MQKTPEDLFYRLAGRSSTHGYLRGPQQDVLREYAADRVGDPDVAFELPTGSGKTAVGLLIAEWKRLAGQHVAYLCLTNQLAGQVLAEAARFGVPVADVRGTRETRDQAEQGRFRTGTAVGVTTYANLFNINPVVRDCELLVFDDAHGAEQPVADMWTVTARRADNERLYASLLADLRPGLTESQVLTVMDESEPASVEMVDVQRHPECRDALTATLDQADSDSVKFAWPLIRAKLHSCLFLASPTEITIRPLIPPTHTHRPFAESKQRLYMSATLGGESDLMRAYGVTSISLIRARSSQWGRRYVFVPGVYVAPERAIEATGAIWDGIEPRRAVLLAPSEQLTNRTFNAIQGVVANKPIQFRAADITNSLDHFVHANNAMLTLAGRYDGLDLPDEQCRLLIMSGSPSAINPLERHLTQRWKLGPIIRQRERTRLIQGLGRCTRNATDFAVIIWLGQSLVDASTSKSVLQHIPSEIAREISWGVRQSEVAVNSLGELLQMALGLLEDAQYRIDADNDIESVTTTIADVDEAEYKDLGAREVRYVRTMWDEDFDRAMELAREITDRVTSPDLAGYRAWWWYLMSVAAWLAGASDVARDALRRSANCGVNSGWIRGLLRGTGAGDPDPAVQLSGGIEANAEGVWELLETWGWAGPRFQRQADAMRRQLDSPDHTEFHQGLETLGKCLGARTTRSTQAGAPDVVWSFPDDLYFAFEAKTEKYAGGTLSKSDLLETRGHREWVHERLCGGQRTAKVETIVVSDSPELHEVAVPFATDIFHMTPVELITWCDTAVQHLARLRIVLSGEDFPNSAMRLSIALRASNMDVLSITSRLLASPLRDLRPGADA